MHGKKSRLSPSNTEVNPAGETLPYSQSDDTLNESIGWLAELERLARSETLDQPNPPQSQEQKNEALIHWGTTGTRTQVASFKGLSLNH